MLLRPSRFTTVPQMIKAVKAMAILHNMIVLERRGHFLGNRRVSDAAAARSGGDGGDDVMGSDGVGGGVAAPPTLGSVAAGSDDPVGRGGGAGHGGVGHTQLEPLPGGSMPNVRIGMDPPPGSFLFFLQARAAFTDKDEFVTLRDDLAEHVYGKRGEYLAPYL